MLSDHPSSGGRLYRWSGHSGDGLSKRPRSHLYLNRCGRSSVSFVSNRREAVERAHKAGQDRLSLLVRVGETPRLIGRLNSDIGISLCREIPTYLVGLEPTRPLRKWARLGWYRIIGESWMQLAIFWLVCCIRVLCR